MSITPLSIKIHGFQLTEPPYVDKQAQIKEEQKKVAFYEGIIVERLFDRKIKVLFRKPRVHVNLTSRKLEIRKRYGTSFIEVCIEQLNIKLDGWHPSQIVIIEGSDGHEIDRIEKLVGAKRLCKLVNDLK